MHPAATSDQDHTQQLAAALRACAITADLAAFLASRGAPFPESGAGNMTGELSFTALGFRQLRAACEDTRHQESPCHHPTC